MPEPITLATTFLPDLSELFSLQDPAISIESSTRPVSASTAALVNQSASKLAPTSTPPASLLKLLLDFPPSHTTYHHPAIHQHRLVGDGGWPLATSKRSRYASKPLTKFGGHHIGAAAHLQLTDTYAASQTFHGFFDNYIQQGLSTLARAVSIATAVRTHKGNTYCIALFPQVCAAGSGSIFSAGKLRRDNRPYHQAFFDE
ncbi:hypothetical protein BAUCODRAFT_38335 [Baudoinia panamericana UAMH 10762]|uniref:Uncharacterized protein n=1 Tax=Baudoinia panamericana (strain UAMH 10762) TaxID=717646 RepID=M2M7K2_BAUPA|nr:uncharacterized protein BAUCODRAFT_38335 [Baudoinia panamericana UAMH 10762]EMC92301.1 hypothetical protein BAUCODRAFT_38335 [Baudoinia panamericana UAMH 10762]